MARGHLRKRRVSLSGSAQFHSHDRKCFGTEKYDIDYQSYGNLYHNYGSSPSDNHYLFTGDESDSETTSDYAVFRNLGTTMGRFNRPDPYAGSYDLTNPQSMNRYTYVLNNPEVFTDWLGLGDVWVCSTTYYPQDGNSGGPVTTCYDIGPDGGGNGGGAGGGRGAPPNKPRTITYCLGQAAKAKGASIALDLLGVIPAFGNAVSATAGVARAAIAVNHVITAPAFALASGAYGGYGAVTAGPGEATDSLVGAGSAGAGIGLTLADVSLEGTKAIPIVGNAVSALTLADVSLEGTKAISIVGNAVSALTFGWDSYQAYKAYESCMAGH